MALVIRTHSSGLLDISQRKWGSYSETDCHGALERTFGCCRGHPQ